MRAIGQKAWSKSTSINNGEFKIMMEIYKIQNSCMLKCRDILTAPVREHGLLL